MQFNPSSQLFDPIQAYSFDFFDRHYILDKSSESKVLFSFVPQRTSKISLNNGEPLNGEKFQGLFSKYVDQNINKLNCDQLENLRNNLLYLTDNSIQRCILWGSADRTDPDNDLERIDTKILELSKVVKLKKRSLDKQGLTHQPEVEVQKTGIAEYVADFLKDYTLSKLNNFLKLHPGESLALATELLRSKQWHANPNCKQFLLYFLGHSTIPTSIKVEILKLKPIEHDLDWSAIKGVIFDIIKNEDLAALKILISLGVIKKEDIQFNIFERVISAGKIELLKQLVGEGLNIQSQSLWKENLFVVPVTEGSSENLTAILEYLKSQQLDPNAVNFKSGRIPLLEHISCYSDAQFTEAACRFFVENGADVNFVAPQKKFRFIS